MVLYNNFITYHFYFKNFKYLYLYNLGIILCKKWKYILKTAILDFSIFEISTLGKSKIRIDLFHINFQFKVQILISFDK